MFEYLLYEFAEAWFLGLMAMLLGRYVGHAPPQLPNHKGKVFLIYLQVWVIAFLGQILFGTLGLALGLSELAQSSYMRFLLPLVAASYFARQLILWHSRRSSK